MKQQSKPSKYWNPQSIFFSPYRTKIIDKKDKIIHHIEVISRKHREDRQAILSIKEKMVQQSKRLNQSQIAQQKRFYKLMKEKKQAENQLKNRLSQIRIKRSSLGSIVQKRIQTNQNALEVKKSEYMQNKRSQIQSEIQSKLYTE